MKLSSKELKVLSTIELKADLSIPELCRLTGYKSHTLRYIINRLQASKVISYRRPIIANEALGFFYTTFFFSLSSRNQKRKNELLSFLTSNSRISWVFELGGDYQYGASFKVKHISEVRQFLHVLAKKFGNIFFEKALSTQLSFIYYGRRYLGDNKAKSKPISFSVDEQRQEIDETDLEIIEGLSRQTYSSNSELSKSLNIPNATFERRRISLEKRGVIKGYFYWVDPEQLSVFSYVIMLFAQGISLDLRAKLQAYAETDKSVVYLTESMGQWDFELGVEVAQAKT